MESLSSRLANYQTLLAPYAVPLKGLLGRSTEEEEDATRFPFQRDRDRIIHTQAFRRLKHKTQVFVAGKGDHYRTRLTHTMEVAQISRDMARTLGLNEDLAETIALAHDLGHTPFGHAGEDAVSKEMMRFGMEFEHNAQSLRVVILLEERTKHTRGLNLNQEVLEGLMKHRTSFDHAQDGNLPRAPSLEAQIVNLADEIAYTAHDTDDGLRAGVFNIADLSSLALIAEAKKQAEQKGTEIRGCIIHLLVMDSYEETEQRINAENIRSIADVYSAHTPLVAFSAAMQEKLVMVRSALSERFYQHPDVIKHSEEGKRTIHFLFTAYEADPPDKVRSLQEKLGCSLPEAIKDYIAGMTDQYALEQAATLKK